MAASDGFPALLSALRGSYRLGSRVKLPTGSEEPLELGTLRVFPAIMTEPDTEPGQWLLAIDPDVGGSQRMGFFVEVASRLGLLPIRLAPSFERALSDPEPICLVADTNALYHGTLAQALTLRAGRATHVAIADQAMMELQRQREKGWTNPKRAPGPPKSGAESDVQAPPSELPAIERWRRCADRARFLAAATRALRRLRESGHVVHIARPPAAMVRYLGGSRGGPDGEELPGGDEDVGSNTLRDRLILEATLQQRVELPGVRVVLVTDDALLAEQARIEGLTVGFGWKAEKIEPPLLTSPYINPRTLQFAHVPLQEFLEEVVWSCSVLTLQREDEGRMLIGRVPEGRRERLLVGMREEGYGMEWSQVDVVPKRWTAAHASKGTAPTVAWKAPPPQRLIQRLLTWYAAEDGSRRNAASGKADEETRTLDAYLQALGWLTDREDSLGPTDRGLQLADAWLGLTTDDVPGWVDWMLDAGSDLDRLPPLKECLKLLQGKSKSTDKELAGLTRRGERTIETQMVLAGAFGRTVRLSGKNWPVAAWRQEDADTTVLATIAEVAGRNPGGLSAASVGRVFTALLPHRPMALPVFRGALYRLHTSGRVRFSGSAPERSEVKIRTLEPTGRADTELVRAREVDLGHGDFLLPGTPACVAEVVTEGR